MEFAPGIPAYLAEVESAFPPDILRYPVSRQRVFYDELCRRFDEGLPQGVSSEDMAVPLTDRRIPLRLYRPEEVRRPGCLLYLHGGGFVFGGLDSHHGLCGDLALAAGIAVLAVAYRLAPEHSHPAALEDAWHALAFLGENAAHLGLDPARLAVGGDSAGGCLAVSLCRRARRRGGPALAGQLLAYPYLGLEVADPARCVSPDAPGLSRTEIDYYRRSYLGGRRRAPDAEALPLLDPDVSGLPPAYVQAVSLDPLQDDAAVYAERLRSAGVECRYRLWPGLVHGSLRARHRSPVAGAAFDELAAAARRFLAD